MSDFDSHITVEKIEDAKDVNCTVKELTFDNTRLKLETPFKVLSGTNLTKKAVSAFSGKITNPIFEIPKAYYDTRTYHALSNAIKEHPEKDKSWTAALRENISLPQHLEETFKKNITVSIAFQYYPINNIELRKKTPKPYQILDIDQYDAFLYFIHSASSVFVLTPDIRLPPSRNRTFSLEDYLRFIDHSVEVLQEYNNKPIFVPIQIDLAINDIKAVLGHYKEKGFTNIWINFKANHCDGSNAGQMELINNQIASFYKDEDVVVYSSHMKYVTDARENEMPAYDIYPSFGGADIIGATRNKAGMGGIDDADAVAQKKGFADKKELKDAVELRKLSLFDADQYKYCIPNCYHQTIDEKIAAEVASNKNACALFNSHEINKELSRAREQVVETGKLRDYLYAKSGVAESMDVFSHAMKQTQKKKTSYQLLIPQK